MIGTYIKEPFWGIGKVIKLRGGYELVYFFKEDNGLHNGGIEPRSCSDKHGWWFSSNEIQKMKIHPPLVSLIERRQQ